MKKSMSAFLMLFLVSFSLVSAISVNITVIDEAGSYSGAILRLKSSEDGELGDKNYPNPSKYLKDAGILKFEIDTSLSEIFFNVVFTKDGAKIKEVDKGPFDVNGSEIWVDLREKEEMEVIKDIAIEENVSEEIASNESLENESAVVLEIEEEVEEVDNYFSDLTGRVMQSVGSLDSLKYSVGGGVLLLAVISGSVLVFMKRTGKKNKNIVNEEDKELEDMKKKLKETEDKIGKLKESKKKEEKLKAAKKKLEEEEKELERLEKGGDEKKIEEQKKEIRDVEERIEDLD